MSTQTLIAPNAQPGMTFFGESGTKYISNASGQIVGVLGQDVESFLNSGGCTLPGSGSGGSSGPVTLGGDLSGTSSNATVVDIGGVAPAALFDAAGAAAAAKTAAIAASDPVGTAATDLVTAQTAIAAIPKSQVEQLVGTMGRPFFNTYSNASYNQLDNASAVVICKSPVTDIRIGFGSWYNPGNGLPEALFGNTLNYRAALLSTAADTVTGVATYQKLYFANGQDNITPVDGDPCVLTEPANFSYSAGATVYAKTNIQAPANGNNLPLAPFVNYSTDSSAVSSTTAAPTPQIYSSSTAVTVPSGGTTYSQSGPLILIGKPKVAQVCFTAQGDSFGEGIGDTTLPLGYINKGGMGAGLAFVNNSRGSQLLSNMEAGCQRQRWTWRYSTDIIDAVGRNDISGGTLTQIQNNKTKFWSDMKATQGCTGKPLRVAAVLIPPYTSTNYRLQITANPALPAGYLPSIGNGGAGYAASSNFNVSLSGGTLAAGGTATVLNVGTNASGVVTTINSVINQGLYTTAGLPVGSPGYPGGTAATTATNGGSGLTINVYYEGWFDLANQTIQPTFGNGQLRDQVNQWMISQVGLGLLDAILDLNTGVWEQNSTIGGTYHGYWSSDLSTASYMTYDGTHPAPRGHTQGGGKITTYLNSLALP